MSDSTSIREDIFEHSDGRNISAADYPQWLKDRLNWFEDLKFGLFLHWGTYCQWDCCESWPLVPEDDWARAENMKCWAERGRDIKRFQTDYWNLNRTFNPTQFDSAKWADIAAKAGFKYVNFTTKHHDGFCMWDTKTTDYKITGPDCPFHTNPKSDIVRNVFDDFRARDISISCYFSKSDWHCPWYWSPEWPALTRNPNYNTRKHPEIWERFVGFVHTQIRELMSNYGPIDVLWLDGGQVQPMYDQDIRMHQIAEFSRNLQPGLIIADRTVGGPYENIITPERQIPDAPLGHTWESCLTMANDWCYTENDVYKPVSKLIHMLIETVAKGGNLLLGTGPTPQGTFTDEAIERLLEIGRWMDVNSEAIYATRPIAPYQQDNIRFTKKGRFIYAIILPDENGKAPEKVRLSAITPAPGSAVNMLGIDEPLTCTAADNGIIVDLPADRLPADHAWTLKFIPK